MNEELKKLSPVFYNSLSKLGQNILLPEGIVFQSAVAKSEAKEVNATIGIATTKNGPMYLEKMKEFFPSFEAKDIFPYAPTNGKPSLRTLWKQKIYRENPSLKGKDFFEPVVVQGLTHATSLLAQLFIEEGTKVLLPNFCWENYDFIFQSRFGAKIGYYQFFSDGRFHWEALQEALTKEQDKKVLVVFNFPHNPTGYSPSALEIEKITEILLQAATSGKKLIVVCDDSYFGLNYEQNIYPESLFGKLVNLHSNLIVAKLDGVTKECYSWGFRIGFLSFWFDSSDKQRASKILESKMQGLIRAELSSTSHPMQTIVERYLSLQNLQKEQEKNKKILQSRYQKLKELLTNSKYQKAWEYYPFNSGYFFCMKIKKVSAKSLWKLLLEKYQVGVIYLDEENIRIAYSSVEEEKLAFLLDTIYQAHQELC